MSTKEARDNFSDLVGSVYYTKEPVVVERKGKPVAVVINPEEYERYQKLAKERFFQAVDRIQARNGDKAADDVLRDVTEVVEEVRQEMYDQRA